MKGKYSVFFTFTLQNLIRFLNESEDLSFSAFPFTDQVDQSSKNKHMTDDEHPIPIYLQISSQGLPLFLGGIIKMYWVLRNLKDQSQQNNEIPSTLHRLLYWPACCYTECKKWGPHLRTEVALSIWRRYGRGQKCAHRVQEQELLTFPRREGDSPLPHHIPHEQKECFLCRGAEVFTIYGNL